ncbi:sensor histidine kinase [Paenibacillus xerothermodurans]|uniref:histidine kinase n=1 Tax=Paenibacillus xerothermodurans TaxID=1977292 RepID=A0A2W1N9L1_PAEXE|nr:HAMP domain-containing sensor histidine kinase [Paenibacillus xerothermodurans]PZE20350.1 sensor histidine kinase [Paenibacillus xerothermodurans]
MSIRLRLTLWYTAILSVTLLLFGIGLYWLLNVLYYDYIEDDLRKQGDAVYRQIQPRINVTLGGDISFDFVLQGQDIVNNTNKFYQITNFQTGKLRGSENLEDAGIVLPPVTDAQKQKLLANTSFFSRTQVGKLQFLIYHMPIPLGNQLAGVFQAAVLVDSSERLFGILRFILVFTASVTVVLAASFGWFLARKALKPIDQVIDDANSIEKGADLGKRINYTGPNDEIGRLTSTINGMLERLQMAYSELEESYRRQRRFVSDASHELRTPLTTIRGNVDLLEKMWKQTASVGSVPERQQLEMSLEAMHDIAGESERMSRLVNDMLSLARADAGIQMPKMELQMLPLVAGVARKAQLLPRSVEWITGDLTPLQGVYVQGNRDYLQQLIYIFVENAFKYTDQGFVKLDAVRTESQIGLRIADTGIGMNSEEVPMIFERFYRVDVSRGKTAGTGLGLSIAKWIIDEHHGSIQVESRPGEGSTFIIWLPISSISDSEREQAFPPPEDSGILEE